MKYKRATFIIYIYSICLLLSVFSASIYSDDLYMADVADVVLVKNDYALKIKPKNSKVSAQIYHSIKLALESHQIKYSQISDQEVEKGALNSNSRGLKVAIFPYNGAMSDSELEEIYKFVQNGGKILSCYEIPPKLQQIYGLKEFRWTKVTRKKIAAIRFVPEASKLGFPEVIKEKPDHIFLVKIDDDNDDNNDNNDTNDTNDNHTEAKAIAYWQSSNEKDDSLYPSYPAALLSKNGIYISSVLKGKDYASIGKLIFQLLQAEPLKEGGGRRAEINTEGVPYTDTDVPASIVRKNDKVEILRGVWISVWIKRDWPKIMRDLHEFGFNAAFVQMNTGGSAYYPSEVLPQAVGHPKNVDDLVECLKWARHYGIQVHVWRTSWIMHNSPDSFVWSMHAEGRLQKRFDGRSPREDLNVKSIWLCPSNELNRNLEVESLLEMVRKYDIDGIHLDYMRFPSSSYCFDENCKSRFQRETGISVKRWPDEVMEGGIYHKEWRQWRKELITSLVERISSEARKLKPNLKISLAARPVLNWAQEHDAQDWPLWAKRGYLDFICPMNYTSNLSKLRERLVPQLKAVDGKVPIYPGIGAYMIKSPIQLAAQIELTRALGSQGFVLFAYGEPLAKWLPMLKKIIKD